ncbi:Cell division cycle protein 48-like [Porphyridium purpureum]|uniref:Cell division cycle protein 48-like n=1 Tax=Porphyridium purpureum TaxID=35688 RepID=A0A5J4YK95_PORPP|nr:Cell division cycle protein 48-like [Porphyridium purpureum]|eukprot:POR9061..scf246_12
MVSEDIDCYSVCQEHAEVAAAFAEARLKHGLGAEDAERILIGRLEEMQELSEVPYVKFLASKSTAQLKDEVVSLMELMGTLEQAQKGAERYELGRFLGLSKGQSMVSSSNANGNLGSGPDAPAAPASSVGTASAQFQAFPDSPRDEYDSLEAPSLHLAFSQQTHHDFVLANFFQGSVDAFKEALAGSARYQAQQGASKLFADIEIDEEPSQGGTKLIPEPFSCRVLPPTVAVIKEAKAAFVQASHVHVAVGGAEQPKLEKTVVAERKVEEELRAFARYLIYTAQPTPDPFKNNCDLSLRSQDVLGAVAEVGNVLMGIEDVQRQMRIGFRLFESTKSLPRGVMFYGPPGTGKTSLIVKLCALLDIHLVAPMLAAGDFAKPLVGQAEEMINQLALRAAAVPWRLCCVVVDEIESLVTSRGKGGGDSSKLSVLLSRIGGVSDVPNLMFFAATNHPEMMDSAFLRRMKIKIFVGPPSSEGRASFVRRLGSDIFETKGHVCNDQGEDKGGSCDHAGCALERATIKMTVNFAASQIVGALTRVRSVLADYKAEDIAVNDAFDLIHAAVAQFTEEENILISSVYNQVNIMAPFVRPKGRTLEHLVRDSKRLQYLLSENGRRKANCSGRIVIDLTAPRDHIQVQLKPQKMDLGQQRFIVEPAEVDPKEFPDSMLIGGGQSFADALGDESMPCLELLPLVGPLRQYFRDSPVWVEGQTFVSAILQYKECVGLAPKKRSSKTVQAFLEQTKALWHAPTPSPASGAARSAGAIPKLVLEQYYNGDSKPYRSLLEQIEKRVRSRAQALSFALKEQYPKEVLEERYECFSFVRDARDLSVEDLLAVYLHLGVACNTTRLLYICREFFHSNKIVAEGEMELFWHEQIKSLKNEYKSGMVIIDYDSLANPVKDKLGEDRFDLVQLMASIAATFRASSDHLWFLAVSGNKAIISRIIENSKWRPAIDTDPPLRCYNCGKWARQSINKKTSCGRHTGDLVLYMKEEDGVQDTGPDGKKKEPEVLKRFAAQSFDERKLIIERVESGGINWKQLRWNCCEQGLFSGNGGELLGPHEFMRDD